MGGGGPKISEAKAAAIRLQAYINDQPEPTGLQADLALVLAHYGKLTKKKVSAKGRYIKGRSYEYEIRDYFNGRGIPCRRVIQSGGGVEKDDLVINPEWGEQRLELKRVAKLPAYLVNECDATIFRQDNGLTRVLVSLERYADLLQ